MTCDVREAPFAVALTIALAALWVMTAPPPQSSQAQQIFTPTPPRIPANATLVAGGTAQNVFAAGEVVHGCAIVNPTTATDEGVGAAEEIWVDFTGQPAQTATGSASPTSVPVPAGYGINCPTGSTTGVSWNAATTSHRVSAYRW